jgi:HEPN domain-containing protein
MTVLPEIADAARRWLRWAAEDLAMGERLLSNEELPPRGAAMWSQQTAEKAIKSILVALDVDPPKQHNLVRLMRVVPAEYRLAITDDELQDLSRWAIEGRYPDSVLEATRQQAIDAIELARQVLELSQTRVEELLEESPS